MSGRYIEVEIIADTQLVEQLVGILTQIGFEGFWEEGTSLRCYISSTRWNAEMEQEIHRVIGMITRSSSSATPTISIKVIEDQNWNEEWEKTIRPIAVTEKIVIAPTWHPHTASSGQLVITIDPKMSFGTGYHETTRLVLKLMEKYVRAGTAILDAGTGTGVLAIAGIKLGASSAVAFDNDEWSYRNARENIQLNGVERYISILHGEIDILPDSTFDLVVANIQRTIIELILDKMKQHLAGDGMMILSGLLQADRSAILQSIAFQQLTVFDELTENEWIALVVK